MKKIKKAVKLTAKVVATEGKKFLANKPKTKLVLAAITLIAAIVIANEILALAIFLLKIIVTKLWWLLILVFVYLKYKQHKEKVMGYYERRD